MEDEKQKSDAEVPDQSGEDSSAARRVALKPKIIEEQVLGIPVLTFGDDAPVLTSEQVEENALRFPIRNFRARAAMPGTAKFAAAL